MKPYEYMARKETEYQKKLMEEALSNGIEHSYDAKIF